MELYDKINIVCNEIEAKMIAVMKELEVPEDMAAIVLEKSLNKARDLYIAKTSYRIFEAQARNQANGVREGTDNGVQQELQQN